MINKQNMWFVTLFSIILVLSIYYVTISDNTLQEIIEKSDQTVSQEVKIEESDVLVALRVSSDEAVLEETEKLQTILLDETASIEEKNDAYTSLQNLNINKGKENKIEELLLKEFNYKSFVKIKNDQINVTITETDHTSEIANKIIRKIQENYDTQMYITIKFQK